MNASNWSQAIAHVLDTKPPGVPTKRHCAHCLRAAELMDVTPDGRAIYICPQRHETISDALTNRGATI